MAGPRQQVGCIRYVACSALALLGYKKLAHPLDTVDAALLLLGVALGMAIAALINDVVRPRHLGAVTALAALLAAASAPATAEDARWLPVTGGCAAAAFLILQVGDLRALSSRSRCTAFAAVFASAGAVNTLTSLSEVPALQVDAPPGTAWYAAIVLAADAALIAATRGHAAAPPRPAGPAAASWLPVAALTIAAATLAMVVFAVGDSPAYPAALDAASPTGWIRLIEVPLFAAVGFACDRLGPRAVMIASLCAGLLGSIGPLLPGSSAVRLAVLACAFGSIVAFCVAMVGMLATYSLGARRPGALCASALIPVVAGQAVAVPIHAVAAGAEPVQLFGLGFVPCVVLVPIVIVLLDRLHLADRAGRAAPRPLLSADGAGEPESVRTADPRGETLAPPFAERWALTRRESEVFALILEELSVPEMAQALFLTTSTVKQHIGHILKKAQAESRAELLRDVRAEWADAPGPRAPSADAPGRRASPRPPRAPAKR